MIFINSFFCYVDLSFGFSQYVQELFAKLTRVAGFATEMFVGRERFATILLMRLTETVILWLSDDRNFWEEIEEGPKTLGPYGLRQVCIRTTVSRTLTFCPIS